MYLSIAIMSKILRIIIGVIFIMSSFLKATDAAAFADLMGRYGAEWFGYAAPVLIAVEFLLGTLLAFNLYPRIVAVATMLFVLSVSAIYLYGVLGHNITNCGCFGPLTWLNSRPWITFIRNGILLVLLVPSIFKPQQCTRISKTSLICIAIVAVAVMFMCGYSFSDAQCLKQKHSFQPVPLADKDLARFVTCHQDSTYLIFAFSYGCPYCQNSIGNVSQYVSMGMVDKVIGLAVSDSVGRERFDRLFDVDFEIREISDFQMYRLTGILPTTWYIRHDSIVRQNSGMVISPALLIP